jgi:hypothetical protein
MIHDFGHGRKIATVASRRISSMPIRFERGESAQVFEEWSITADPIPADSI